MTRTSTNAPHILALALGLLVVLVPLHSNADQTRVTGSQPAASAPKALRPLSIDDIAGPGNVISPAQQKRSEADRKAEKEARYQIDKVTLRNSVDSLLQIYTLENKQVSLVKAAAAAVKQCQQRYIDSRLKGAGPSDLLPLATAFLKAGQDLNSAWSDLQSANDDAVSTAQTNYDRAMDAVKDDLVALPVHQTEYDQLIAPLADMSNLHTYVIEVNQVTLPLLAEWDLQSQLGQPSDQPLPAGALQRELLHKVVAYLEDAAKTAAGQHD